MKAKDKLYDLYAEVKAEGNCKGYVQEMCAQLTIFGIESNTLTKQMVHDEVEKVLNKHKKCLDN